MAADARVLEQYSLRPELSAPRKLQRNITSFIRTKPLGAFGAFIVIVLILMALFPAAFTFGKNPDEIHLVEKLRGPSASNWFGTDQLGRDQYTRIVYGARTSILIGFGVVAISSVIAAILGTVSGYFGGWFDMFVQRIVDIGIALPGLIFIILVVTTLQDIPKTVDIIVSVGLLLSVGSSRVIRGAAIAAKQNQYVEAARVIGASDTRIIARHILPNVTAVILIGASIQIGGAVLI